MTEPELAAHAAAIRAAWRELLGPAVASLESGAGLEVLVIQPAPTDRLPDDEWFSYLATAGLSAGAEPADAGCELLLRVRGRRAPEELRALAERLFELGARVPLAPGQVLDVSGLAPFARMNAALVADFVPGEVEWLHTPSGRARVLQLHPLLAEERAVAASLGDVELLRQARLAGAQLDDPERPALALHAFELEQIWADIEEWLRQHAPATARGLRAGATEAALRELARGLGCTLPADYRASLARHDGYVSLWGYEYLSAAVALKTARTMSLTAGWRDTWIPFSVDGGGNLLCLDVSKPPSVVAVERSGEVFRMTPPTFTAWLSRYRDALLAGGVYGADEDGRISRL